MDRPPSRPVAAPAALLTVSLMLIAACAGGSPAGSDGGPDPGGGEPSDAAASQPAEGEPTPGTSLTACELITPADIESVLGLDPGTVSEGALEEQPGVLDPYVTECRYNDETWGALIVNLTPADGANVWDALVDVYGDQAEAVDVGEGGLWFEDNDRGYFFQDPVMVRFQFQFLTDGTPFRDPTIELGEIAIDKL